MTKNLNDHLKLKHCYNVNDLIKLKTHKNFRIITFDIKNLYVNIAIHETLNFTKTLLVEHNDGHITKQMVSLLHIILQQNYLSFQNNIFQPEKRISMGSPISGIINEIFLQYLENIHLNQILEEKRTVFYTRYVDTIFIIYDAETIKIHDYMNKLYPNLEFTPTLERNDRISFLDLLITRQPSII
jgi:hypothetical protein